MTLPQEGLQPPPLPYMSPAGPQFRGKRGGLVAFGVILIVLGIMAGALGMLVLAVQLSGIMATSPEQLDRYTLVSALVTYLAVAVAFIGTGIGSVRCRRWVRPIALVIAWTWLITGVITTAMMAVFSVYQFNATSQMAGPMPPRTATVTVLIVTGVFTIAFIVVLPALMAWFYHQAAVQQTLDFYDPGPSWTDRCPTSALGLSLGMWLAAGFVLLTLMYGTIPFFGFVLDGIPAIAVKVLAVALLAYGGWTSFQCRPVGWWVSMLAVIAGTVSWIVSFLRLGVVEFYRATGASPNQIEQFQAMPTVTLWGILLTTIVMGLACVIYMLVIRKHFRSSADIAGADLVENRLHPS